MVIRQRMVLEQIGIHELTGSDLDGMFEGFRVAGWGFFRPKKKMPMVKLELLVSLIPPMRAALPYLTISCALEP